MSTPDRDRIRMVRTHAWLMTAAFVVMMAGAILHGDWLATWFAFSAAFFAWRVVIVKKMTANSKARETGTAAPEGPRPQADKGRG